MDIEISFDGKMLVTLVYIKMDAHDQLLLSEGVRVFWSIARMCGQVVS